MANAMVFSKSKESLETVNQYVEILLRKVAARPEVSRLLEDLQDICNIRKEHFRIKLEYFNLSEAIREIVNMNRMQADKKNIDL